MHDQGAVEPVPIDRPDRHTPAPKRSANRAKATGWVGGGMIVMNALVYAFNLLCARALVPHDFGATGSLMGVLIVANVGSLALQATAARRLATVPPSLQPAVTHDVLSNGWRVALAFGAVLAVLSPAMVFGLHLDTWWPALLTAAACVPLTLMGAQAGVLQGERRWRPLAGVFLANGIGRVVCGSAALLIHPSVTSVMAGVAAGALMPALVGGWWCRTSAAGRAADHEPVLRELWRNGHTLLAFFALTNVDVLLARHLFDGHTSGVYAAGSILAKAGLFLPSFVVIVAFPAMARIRATRTDIQTWRRPFRWALGIGAVSVAGTALLPHLAVTFSGGSQYTDLAAYAWLFVAEGTVFACLQILVYDTIADQRHLTHWIWGTAVVVVAVSLVTEPGPVWLVAGVTAASVVLAGVIVAAVGRAPQGSA